MDDSILNDVKKLLGIAPDYEHFDIDIIIHINSAFMVLNQIGVGPSEGFSIRDSSSKWQDFTSDLQLIEAVRSYVYLSVRLVFDPPTTSFVLDAMKEKMKEYEWRINVMIESGKEVKSDG